MFNPITPTPPQLTAALGKSDLIGFRIGLTHDTRDNPFLATQGHYLDIGLEQVVGTFVYPRAEAEYRQYFLIRERVDHSGRHTISVRHRVGFTGNNTPVYENFFAGGFSTLRGFDFRGASPRVGNVVVGGQFMFLGSVEYMMPLTADDMLRAVAFVDYGTVEESTKIEGSDFRVAPGVGLRITVPALGPAPIALDFAFPIAEEAGDDKRTFSFFIGFGR